jgi:uncharacterized protein YggU (UPF0235/DUF167 family)
MKILVKVKPNSKQQTIIKDEDGSLLVKLKSPPIDGKANVITYCYNIKNKPYQIEINLNSS